MSEVRKQVCGRADAGDRTEEREFFIDNLLVRIHLIIEVI